MADATVALLRDWFPDHATCRAFARLVASSVQLVHRNAPGGWELTLRNNYGRLNVGQVAVLDFGPDWLALYAMGSHYPDTAVSWRQRRPPFRGYKAVPGRHERWYVEPSAVPRIPKRLHKAHIVLLEAAWTAKRKTPHAHAHTPNAVEAIATLAGVNLPQPAYLGQAGRRPRSKAQNRRTGIYGDPVSNRQVEAAAIRLVIRDFEARGWTVVSRERDGCGYDLDCTKGRQRRHVEVKGRSNNSLVLIMTPKELEVIESDATAELIIVTQAAGAGTTLHRFKSVDFVSRFVVEPAQYRASPGYRSLEVD